jgi:single-strand DNA-binding protein
VSAQITLVGRLAADPEQKATANGKTVTRFPVITSRRKMNQDTKEWEDTDVTSWQCTAWDILAERVGRLRKGMAVVVSGQVSSRSWEDKQTGEKRYAMQVTASDVGLNLRWQEPDGSRSAAPAVASFSEPDSAPLSAPVSEPTQSAFDNDIPF